MTTFWDFLWNLFLWFMALAIPTLAIGCRSAEQVQKDPLMWSRAFQQAGVQTVKICVMGGDGHMLGWSYNPLGWHWAVIGDADPSQVTTERIQAFFPRGFSDDESPLDPNLPGPVTP